MYDVGEVVVYPGHGVCKIEKVVKREVADTVKRFFLLRIMDADICILIPEDKIDHAGLRRVIDQAEADRVLEILKGANDSKFDGVHSKQSWNKRFREYMDRIKTGNVMHIAQVLKTLSLIKEVKGLSFGEKRILNVSKALLAQEIAVAKRLSVDRALSEIESALNGWKSS